MMTSVNRTWESCGCLLTLCHDVLCCVMRDEDKDPGEPCLGVMWLSFNSVS